MHNCLHSPPPYSWASYSVRIEETVLENINDFVLRQCGAVEKRMSEFLALYQQPHIDQSIQEIAGLYASMCMPC